MVEERGVYFLKVHKKMLINVFPQSGILLADSR